MRPRPWGGMPYRGITKGRPARLGLSSGFALCRLLSARISLVLMPVIPAEAGIQGSRIGSSPRRRLDLRASTSGWREVIQDRTLIGASSCKCDDIFGSKAVITVLTRRWILPGQMLRR
jgi:hypothetical protein